MYNYAVFIWNNGTFISQKVWIEIKGQWVHKHTVDTHMWYVCTYYSYKDSNIYTINNNNQ